MYFQKIFIGTIALIFLVGCASQKKGIDSNDSLSRNFGHSTTTNHNVMSIKKRQEYIKNLTRLFATQVPTTVNFAFNSAKINSKAQVRLFKQAIWIINHPNITFRVYGHTDRVGSDRYNYRLGQKRAQAVVDFLIKQGVNAKKVEAVVSYGKTRPLVLIETKNRDNRRTVTEVKSFYNPNDFGLLDGELAFNIYRSYIQAPSNISATGGSGAIGIGQ